MKHHFSGIVLWPPETGAAGLGGRLYFFSPHCADFYVDVGLQSLSLCSNQGLFYRFIGTWQCPFCTSAAELSS